MEDRSLGSFLRFIVSNILVFSVFVFFFCFQVSPTVLIAKKLLMASRGATS